MEQQLDSHEILGTEKKSKPEIDDGQVDHASKLLADSSHRVVIARLTFFPKARSMPSRRRWICLLKRIDLERFRRPGITGADAPGNDVVADRVASIPVAGDQFARRVERKRHQCVGTIAVRRFAAGGVEAERCAECVTDAVNLTGEPGPQAANSLFARPSFAPRPTRGPGRSSHRCCDD